MKAPGNFAGDFKSDVFNFAGDFKCDAFNGECLATPNHTSEDNSSDTNMLMLEKIRSRPFFALISADSFVHPSWRSGRKGKIVFYIFM